MFGRGMVSVAALRLVDFWRPCFLGLAPQANNLPPLRGSCRKIEEGPLAGQSMADRPVSRRHHSAAWIVGDRDERRRHHSAAWVVGDRDERRRHRSAALFARDRDERRRRDRYLAWGVSPRYEETKLRMSPRGATDE